MKNLLIAATLAGVAYLVWVQYQKQKNESGKESGSKKNKIPKAVEGAIIEAKMKPVYRGGKRSMYSGLRADFRATESATFSPAKAVIS